MAELYCPACGVRGATLDVRRDARDLTECATCGLVLEANEVREYEPIGEILLADDSDLLRLAIEDVLVEKSLARSVQGARDGLDFVERFVRRLREGKPVDLVMLDVQMPNMNGFNAAVALRAIERAFDKPHPTPIVFFSAQACDDTARNVLRYCGQAIYVNKVASPNLAELAGRVEQVLVNILTKSAAAAPA